VGQAELDVARAAHTTLIVLVPESGDGIQAMKAGLMEIGDVFAVNKSDREGADCLMVEIQMMLDMRPGKSGWNPAVLKTTACTGEGIGELAGVIRDHRKFLEEHQLLIQLRKENIRSEIMDLVLQRIAGSLWQDEQVRQKLDHLVEDVAEGKMSPFQAYKNIIKNFVPLKQKKDQ
jgi:LAO/AO transport system kinase